MGSPSLRSPVYRTYARRMLVLIVDDDERVLRALVRALKRSPVHVITATSGEYALELIARDGVPSLVICDYQLPGMDGLSFLATVRLEHPEVRLVLSTGTSKSPALGSGIGLLPKPVDAAALSELIASLLAPRA